MKLPSLAFLSLSLLAASSAVDAACYRRSRRSLAKRSPSVEGANAGRVQKVQRRQKSGWRMDGQHGNASAALSNGSGSPGKNNWSSSSAASFSAGGGNEQQAIASPSSSSMTTQPSTQKTKTASSSASKSTSTSTGSSSSSSSSSSSGSTYTGEATYYLQGGVAGNCGTVHSDTDKIIALQTSMYASGEYCGKTVTIKNTANSKTVTATVADSCPSCSSSSSIDLSQATFEAIGDLDTGVLTVEWSFTD